MDSDSMSLVVVFICLLFSGFFSAVETAFSTLNRIRIKNMAEKGDKRAALVLSLSDRYDALLSTILIGNNIVNIMMASVATLLFVKWLGSERGASASTIVVTVLVLIFGEISPKSLAKESPEKLALMSAPLLQFFVLIFTPLNLLFGLWKKLLSRIFKSTEDTGITEEELLTIVEEAEEDGGIDEQESTLIRSAIEFSELEAGDILTPRVDITGIEVDTPEEEIAQAFIETGYSRMPVYEDTMDNIVGIIYQKDFYKLIYHQQGGNIHDIIRSAFFITKNLKIGELLKSLQQSKQHIAVVLDEFGGTLGIVTLEDILEELVGEIWDEHDTILHEVEKVSDHEYMVLGSTDIEKLFELLDKEQEFEFHTVNGWVTAELGRLAEEGDHFFYENLEVTVLERSEKRVEKVRIIVHDEDNGAEDR